MAGLAAVTLAGGDVPGAAIHALELGMILATVAAALARPPVTAPVVRGTPRTLVRSA